MSQNVLMFELCDNLLKVNIPPDEPFLLIPSVIRDVHTNTTLIGDDASVTQDSELICLCRLSPLKEETLVVFKK